MKDIVYIRKKGTDAIHIALPHNLASKRIKKGGDLEVVSKEEAEAWMKSISVPKAQPEPASKEPSEADKILEEQKALASIVEAIGSLTDEDYTKPNPNKPRCPKTDALALLVGFPVSGAQRDEAWKIYQETHTEE